MDQHVKVATDVVAASTLAAALIGWLPTVAAAFSIAWIGMQMVINWDSFIAKVKGWFK